LASGFNNFGFVKTEYIIVKGSIPGVAKRPVLLTTPLRPTKFRAKKKLEVVELR
jgi:large subunit ribosomal protein L3